jgi:hypothetical protein
LTSYCWRAEKALAAQGHGAPGIELSSFSETKKRVGCWLLD